MADPACTVRKTLYIFSQQGINEDQSKEFSKQRRYFTEQCSRRTRAGKANLDLNILIWQIHILSLGNFAIW